MAVYISQATAEYFNTKGIDYYEDLAAKKSAVIYEAIDNSSIFECLVTPELRSSQNQVFYAKVGNEEQNKLIEDDFVYQSRMNGFLGLKGHRAAGGLRSTVYNAVTIESAQALADYIRAYERENQ
jgi:phosphoserine aminotransferase